MLRRLRRIELPAALFDAAGSFVPGDGDADMVGANLRACSGYFLLRLAVCQGKPAGVGRSCGIGLVANRPCGSRDLSVKGLSQVGLGFVVGVPDRSKGEIVAAAVELRGGAATDPAASS